MYQSLLFEVVILRFQVVIIEILHCIHVIIWGCFRKGLHSVTFLAVVAQYSRRVLGERRRGGKAESAELSSIPAGTAGRAILPSAVITAAQFQIFLEVDG